MSNRHLPWHLPPELLDHIVSNLWWDETALGNCCLISKSWIPRTRKYLFDEIIFNNNARELRLWKGMFPDPSTSPGCYTKVLFINCPHEFTAADAGEGGWIKAFSRVERLEVECPPHRPAISLVPFHGLSPVIKTLYLHFTSPSSSEVFNLILSFPLLEDLTVISYDRRKRLPNNGDGSDLVTTGTQPSSSPAFTGTLTTLNEGASHIAYRLLSLPGGIHFRELSLAWFREREFSLAAALVEECSQTLESINIAYGAPAESRPASIDLSRTMRLKDASFRINSWGVNWITDALRTITPEHRDLREITIHMCFGLTFAGVGANVRQTIGENIFGWWTGLDLLLVRLSESHSIHLKIQYYPEERKKKHISDCVGCLLPEATGRRIIHLVDRYGRG